LRHQPPRKGLLLCDNAISALQDARQEDDNIEKAIECVFLVDFPRRGNPRLFGEKALLAVEEGSTDLNGFLRSATSLWQKVQSETYSIVSIYPNEVVMVRKQPEALWSLLPDGVDVSPWGYGARRDGVIVLTGSQLRQNSSASVQGGYYLIKKEKNAVDLCPRRRFFCPLAV